MYGRELAAEIEQLAKEYPIVTVVGPRQSGKTTLVQFLFPDKPYVSLEDPDTREFAMADPRAFLGGYPEGAVLDEIQRVPPLLSYIQTIVDAKKQNGLFILTGSHQLELHQAISQSLAGRTALTTLLPLSLQELRSAGIELSLDEALLKGGYPRIFREKQNATKAYRNYLQTYIERDLRDLIHVKDLTQFQRFLRLCAGRIGQLLNLQSLAGDVGVSSHTIKHWLSILEASFIVVRLPPYHNNFNKRLIKTPKLYFTDVGVACALLGIKNATQLSRDPLRGNLVENLMLLELMKARLNAGMDPELYLYRDVQGHEVDFLFRSGHELIPIEVKAGTTFNSEFLKNLRYFQKLANESRGYLLYGGTHEQKIDSIQLLNHQHAADIFRDISE